ncbi:MAG: hypothetical protein WKF47_04755 [Geodermatophilaceae bacterium]
MQRPQVSVITRFGVDRVIRGGLCAVKGRRGAQRGSCSTDGWTCGSRRSSTLTGGGAASALSGVVSGLASAVKAGGKGALVGGAFLAELLATTATRLPLRDKATLLVQHPGLDPEELADSLTVAAARVTGTVGGAAGGLAAAQWFATPSLIAVPVELVAETLLVAAVELKLVAELHEIYDARPPGDLGERANCLPRAHGPRSEGCAATVTRSAWPLASPRPVRRRCASGSPGGWPAISVRFCRSWPVP